MTLSVGNCKICGTKFDNKLHLNCGGDCLSCMADIGDTDCQAAVEKIHANRVYLIQKVGIYRHETIAIIRDVRNAVRATGQMVRFEPDAHHSYYVTVVELDTMLCIYDNQTCFGGARDIEDNVMFGINRNDPWGGLLDSTLTPVK